jgi:hypothetical protein
MKFLKHQGPDNWERSIIGVHHVDRSEGRIFQYQFTSMEPQSPNGLHLREMNQQRVLTPLNATRHDFDHRNC